MAARVYPKFCGSDWPRLSPAPVESAYVETVFQVSRLGTSPLLPNWEVSHRPRSRLTAETPERESSTCTPMTSEFGTPITVTVRLASYLVVRVPS
ncbi:hypothetical protein [Streptomyces chartreusis]